MSISFPHCKTKAFVHKTPVVGVPTNVSIEMC